MGENLKKINRNKKEAKRGERKGVSPVLCHVYTEACK